MMEDNDWCREEIGMVNPQIDEFLQRIEYPNHAIYRHIDEVFVPPIDYPQMQRSLAEKRVLFLVSKWGGGATFTAIKLMWEFFQRGYTPQWRYWCRKAMKNEGCLLLEGNERALFPAKTITYIEDPFGKAFFGREYIFGTREFLKIIGLLETIYAKNNDVYVIISTNEEIYQELEKYQLYPQNVDFINHHANKYAVSHDKDGIIQLFRNWGYFLGCTWTNDLELITAIVNAQESKNLPLTPLFIKDLAFRSRSVNDKTELMGIILNSSGDPLKLFVEEIKAMSTEEKYFFSRLFLKIFIDPDKTGKIDKIFPKLLKFKPKTIFPVIVTKYREIRINVVDSKNFEFTHPSYLVALKQVLLSDGDFNQIFNQVFAFLAKYDLVVHVLNDQGWDLSWIILSLYRDLKDEPNQLPYFLVENDPRTEHLMRQQHVLPNELKQMELKIVGNEQAEGYLAMRLLHNYNQLPDVARSLLFRLFKEDKSGSLCAISIDRDFKAIPLQDLEKIISLLTENPAAIKYVVVFLINHYSELPKKFQDLMFTLFDKEELKKRFAAMVPRRGRMMVQTSILMVYEGLARTILSRYQELPETVRNLILKMVERDDLAELIEHTVAYNLKKLPEDIRRKLIDVYLENYGKKGNRAPGKGSLLEQNFNAIPEATRVQMVSKLIDHPDNHFMLAEIFIEHYDELDSQLRVMFDRFIKDESTSRSLALAIMGQYPKAHPYFKQILINLLQNPKFLRFNAGAILRHYQDLPREIQQMIFQVPLAAKDDDSREEIFSFISSLFSSYGKLPAAVQDFVFKVVEAYPNEATINILTYFNELPEKLRNLLPKLFETAPKTDVLGRALLFKLSRIPKPLSNQLIQTLLRRLEIRGVIELVLGNYADVEGEFKQIPFIYSEDAKYQGEVAFYVAWHYEKLPGTLKQLFVQIYNKAPANKRVAEAIVGFYSHLPTEIQHKVFELAKQESVNDVVGLTILTNSESLPDDVVALLPSLEKFLLEKLDKDLAQDPKNIRGLFRLVGKNADPRISTELRQKVIALMQNYGDEKVQEHLQALQEASQS